MRDIAGYGCAVVDHLLASAAADCAGDGCFVKQNMGWSGGYAEYDNDVVVCIALRIA